MKTSRNAFARSFVTDVKLQCACGKRFAPSRSDAKYCSNACRQRAYRTRKHSNVEKRIVTVHGNNADLIAKAAKLYVADGAIVADVTYGLGAFWRKTNTERFTLLRSDLLTCEHQYDFRDLLYEDGSIDTVVFDPPYAHHGHVIPWADHRYKNAATTKGLDHSNIMRLYEEGMREAVRVLKPGGQLWVKCKDEIESGRQRWSHIELYHIAQALGLFARDLFVLVPHCSNNAKRWKSQRHARKAHSYLWIFQLR